MSTFTKQFVSADEYEKWLREAGERINVITITHPTNKSVYKPRQLWIRNPSAAPSNVSNQPAAGAITVKYQTDDRTLAPKMSRLAVMSQVALIALVFFSLFIYAILKL